MCYLKAPGFQDGHAGYSDPLDEQTFIVNTINFLQKQPEWSSTAVVITYDDSDGWYDHQMGPIVNAFGHRAGLPHRDWCLRHRATTRCPASIPAPSTPRAVAAMGRAFPCW